MVPVNIRLAPPEIIEILSDCEASVIVVDDAFTAIADQLKAGIKSVKHIVFIGEGKTPTGMHNVEDLIKNSSPLPPVSCGNDDTYGIFYTGGTTGKSKGVMLTHTNVMVNALSEVGKLNYNSNTRYLHCAPMFHLADGGNTFAVTMATGCHYFLMFNPPGVLAEINRAKTTHVVLVPTMLQMTLALPNLSDFNLDTVEYIIYGGSPMPEILLTKAVEVFKNAKFIQGYGMTECAPGVSNLFPEYHTVGNPKLTSCGVPVPHAEVKV